MDTSERFSRLYELLVQQDDVVTKLLLAGEEQTECLRRNDARGVHSIVLRQEALAAELGALEEERVQVQQSLGKGLNFSATASLSDLAVRAGEPTGQKLKEIRAALLEKSKRLREINALNQSLTRQALQFTGLMIDILQPPKPAYTSDGDKKKTSNRRFILNKTI